MAIADHFRRLWARIAPQGATRLFLATVAIAAGAGTANRLVSAQCFVQNPGTAACRYNGTNPCTYDTCRVADNTCQGGGQQAYGIINGLTKPQNWPRCTGTQYLPPPLPNKNCSESWLSCGTTQHYSDSLCSTYCVPTVPGQWLGCRAPETASPCY